MVRPQERLQIALVVRSAFRKWDAMIDFKGLIEQVATAQWVSRIHTATCTPPVLRSRDLFGLEGRDALPPRCGGSRTQARWRRPWRGSQLLVVVAICAVLAEQANRAIERARSRLCKTTVGPQPRTECASEQKADQQTEHHFIFSVQQALGAPSSIDSTCGRGVHQLGATQPIERQWRHAHATLDLPERREFS